MDFHSALSTKAAAESAKSRDSSQVGPRQTRDADSQAAGARKKNSASASSIPDIAAPLILPPKPLSQALTVSLPVTLPPDGEASGQASQGPETTVLQNTGVAALPSAATSNSSCLPTFAGQQGNLIGKNDAISGDPKVALPSAQTPSESGIDTRQKSGVGATNQLGAGSTGAVSEPTAPQSSAIDQSSAAALLAAQQAAAAVAQSVAAPGSLPTLNTARVFQTPATAERDAGTSGVADTLKGAASRQTISASNTASKTKPNSSSADVHEKSAADADDQSQALNGTATGTPVVKVPEAAVTTVHPTAESHGALDPASLQSISTGLSTAASNHIAQGTPGASAPTTAAAQSPAAQASADNSAMQGLSSAQLTQSMRSSEMKLGMQSAEFGNISISTSLNHQAISAQISIDHAELGRALAVHLPAIEEKLGSSYGLQARVELRESNNPSSSNESAYSNSGQQSRQQRQTDQSSSSSGQTAMFGQVATQSSLVTTAVTANASRLDIRI